MAKTAVICILLVLGLGAAVLIKRATSAGEAPTAEIATSTTTAPTSAPGSARSGALADRVAGAPADRLLDAALDAIARQQETIKNLTASGALKEESLDRKTGEWEPRGEREATATYDGAEVRRCQIACRLSKTATPDEPAPFRIERYVVVYDGKAALKLIEPDTGLWIAMCEISAGQPPEVDDTARATGLIYSTWGWKEPSSGAAAGGEGLLAVLRESRQLAGFHAEKVTEAGRDFLKVIAPRPDAPNSGGRVKSELHFWFDLQKAYALARVEGHLAEPGNWQHKAWQMDATDFTEPMSGLFYPKHVELRSFGTTRETEALVLNRTAVDVSGVQMNAQVADDTFNIGKVELPVGTSNLRDANGEVIRFTPDEQQRLFAQVARQVLARAQREKAAATQSGRKP